MLPWFILLLLLPLLGDDDDNSRGRLLLSVETPLLFSAATSTGVEFPFVGVVGVAAEVSDVVRCGGATVVSTGGCCGGTWGCCCGCCCGTCDDDW